MFFVVDLHGGHAAEASTVKVTALGHGHDAVPVVVFDVEFDCSVHGWNETAAARWYFNRLVLDLVNACTFDSK